MLINTSELFGLIWPTHTTPPPFSLISYGILTLDLRVFILRDVFSFIN
jgi:hypothetical protein